jgi:hypothetical protein
MRLLLWLDREGVVPAGGCRHNLLRVLGFFGYLLTDIEAHAAGVRKEKEAEMKEYEKLAGWDSNEYLIFKATCEKFQRKIHHILKRYDEELSLPVGQYHQQLLGKQVHNSISDFRQAHSALLGITPEQEDGEKGEEGQEEDKMDAEAEADEGGAGDEYELISRRIFEGLSELQQEHHNTQSKLLIIRHYLSELEEAFGDFSLSSQAEYKYLTADMFATVPEFDRASKYYYGLWDKLCQRSETKWHREVVDRLWLLAEKVWVHINQALTYAPLHHPDETATDLRVIASGFLATPGPYHPLFSEQL